MEAKTQTHNPRQKTNYSKTNCENIKLPYNGKDPNVIRCLFLSFVKKNYPDYLINDEIFKPLNYLIDIVTGNSDKKGLVIRGTVGSGKTLLVTLWLEFRQNYLCSEKIDPMYERPKKVEFSVFTPATLQRLFSEMNFKFFSSNFGDVLFLDDIGEHCEINNFGTKVNLLSELISGRYLKHKFNPELELIATTNLTSDRLKTTIGERAFSRLNEMCEWDSGILVCDDRRFGNRIVKEWPKVIWKQKPKLPIYNP